MIKEKHLKKNLFHYLNNMNEKYTGWLVSTSLIERSLAVLGHYIL